MDATNYSIAPIVAELIRRNNFVRVYGYSLDYHNIRMFTELNIDVFSLNDLTDEILDWCDIILSSNDMIWRVIDVKKYIFAFNAASVMRSVLSEGGDIMFLPSYTHYRDGIEENVSVVTGNTKSVIKDTNIQNGNHRILFIDSGHYPFSCKGKRIIAELLIQICEKFPEYEVVVKPRFLPQDNDLTHRNKKTVYSCVLELNRTIPSNMNYLMQHTDLEQLIISSDVVICMYSSAFLDAIAHNKPSIVISGLPCQDSVDNNNKYFWNIYETLFSESGCVVNYTDVIKCLPDGRHCTDAFLKKMSPSFKNIPPYEIVCDIISFVYLNFISQNKFVKICHTDADNYLKDFSVDDSGSWEKLIKYRYINEIRYIYTRFFNSIGIDYKNTDIENWSCNQIKKIRLSSEKFDKIHYKTNRHIKKVLTDFDRKCLTPVQESYWLEAAFDIARYKIDNIGLEDTKCKRSLLYFKGLSAYEKKNYCEALAFLREYNKETADIEFDEYVTDVVSYQNRAEQIICELFPFDKVKKNSKIIIYGAGYLGNKHIYQISETGYCTILAVADKNADRLIDSEYEIISPDHIIDYDYDNIIISIKSFEVQTEVKEYLRQTGVDIEKIITVGL